MTLAISKLAAPVPHPGQGWIEIGMAAVALGMDEGHLRRKCREELEVCGMAVFARSPGGGQPRWFVHQSYSPALRTPAEAEKSIEPDLNAYTPRQREGALRRKVLVEKLRHARLTAPKNITMERVIQGIIEWSGNEFPDMPVSRSALLRWDHDFAGPADLTKLIDKRGTKTKSKASEEAWEALTGLYLSENRPSLRFCWREVKRLAEENGWTWTGYRNCALQINDHISIEAQTFNREPGVYRKTMAPYIAQDPESWRAGQLWVADHKLCDVWVKKGGRAVRPWLTAFLDWRTRRITGWALSESPSSDSIRRALKMGMTDPFNMGGPDMVTVDNGKDFSSFTLHGSTKKQRRSKGQERDAQAMAGIFGLLKIHANFTQPYSPTSKARMERFFGTLSSFFRTFNSYCGLSADTKPETLPEILEGQSLPTFGEFETRLGNFITGKNASADHAILDLAEDGQKLSPDAAYALWCDRKRVFADPDAVNLILGGLHALASVTRNGIALNVQGATYYYGQYLAELVPFKAQKRADREKVFAIYDPANMGEIQVFDQQWKFICFAPMNQIGGSQLSRDAMARAQREKRTYLRGLKAVNGYGLASAFTAEERAAHAEIQMRREAEAAATAHPHVKLADTSTDGQAKRMRKRKPPRDIPVAVGAESVGQHDNRLTSQADALALLTKNLGPPRRRLIDELPEGSPAELMRRLQHG